MNMLAMNNEITMGTREIAEMLGKNHSDLKRSAERLAGSGIVNGGQPLADTPYIHEQNGQTYFEYRLNKRDSLVLVAQNSPEFTAAIVDRWQELEAKQGPQLPQSYSAALLEAGRLALEVEQRDQLLASQAPKVEFAEQVAGVDKGITLSVFAKSVGIGPNRLFAMLRDTKVLMSCRDERWNLPMQEYVDRGYLATREGTYHDSNGALRLKFTPLITGKGQQWLVSRLIREGVLRGVAACQATV
ncbi:MAG: phage antirepressor KilAC domain-containing protein [Aeromonas sp.]